MTVTFPHPTSSSTSTASTSMDGTSLRNLLLANIALQTDLTDQLFSSLAHAALPQPPSRTARSSSRLGSDFEAIPSIYENLIEATEEQARLLEHARRHQKKWRQLQWKRERVQEMENRVRRILVELEHGQLELEELVQEGKVVVEKIELAEKAKFPMEDLLAYAQNLATTTSRPPSLDPPAPLLSAEMLYPVESVMQSGKLAALARGEVVGILGDRRVIGTAEDQPGPQIVQSGSLDSQAIPKPDSFTPPQGPAIPAVEETGGAQMLVPETLPSAVRAPFKLDLSDSEDDD